MKKLKKIIMVMAIAMLYACSTDDTGALLSQPSASKYQTSNFGVQNPLDTIYHYTSWRGMMEDIKGGKKAQWFAQLGITLKSYEATGQTLSEIGDEKLLKKAIFPIFDDSLNINALRLVPYEGCNTLLSSSRLDAILSMRKYLIGLCPMENLEMVKMYWNVGGKDIITYAVVTKRYIIYDDIFSNTRIITIEKAQKGKRKIRRMKTMAEVDSRNDISFHHVSPYVKMDAAAGTFVARAYCTITVTGKDEPKEIESYQYDTPTYANLPIVTAYSNCQVRKFEKGPNGHADFIYAIAVGYATMKCEWTGASYNISGAYESHTSELQVTPDRLN